MEIAVFIQHVVGDEEAGTEHRCRLFVPQGIQGQDIAPDGSAGIPGILESAFLIHLLALHRVVQQGVAGGDVSRSVIGPDPDDLAPGAVVIDLAGLLVHIHGVLIGEGEAHPQLPVFVEGIQRDILGVDLGCYIVLADQEAGGILGGVGQIQPNTCMEKI